MKTNHATNQKIWAVTIQEENKQTNKQVFPLDLDYLLSIMNENVFERERERGDIWKTITLVVLYVYIDAFTLTYLIISRKQTRGRRGFISITLTILIIIWNHLVYIEIYAYLYIYVCMQSQG